MKRIFFVLLLTLLWCAPAKAATYDSFIGSCATSSGTSIGSCSLTVGSGVTNGAVQVGILFDVSVGSPSGISITVGGNAATLLSGSGQTGGFANSYIYCIATGSTTGATAIAASWTGTSGARMIAVSASGVDQTTPCNNGTAENPGFGGIYSLVITSAVGDLSIDFAGALGIGAPVVNPNQTSITQDANGFTSLSSSRATTPAATVTHTWDALGGFETHSGGNFKANGGGGATRRRGGSAQGQ